MKVNEVTATLFVKYRTPEDYLRVPEDELRADIKPTGFYNQKAASIRATCARLIEVYDGQVPDTMEELLTLRGVARKTANIVLANGVRQGRGHPRRHPRAAAVQPARVLRRRATRTRSSRT